MKTEIVEFKATDGVILNGYIKKCEEKTEKLLIQIHGMTSNCFKKREKIVQEKISELNIDTLCFNNRGSDVIRYAKKYEDGIKTSILAGTTYEDVEDSYYDIKGAINYALNLGYTNIYLYGHSLGSTKIVYTYNKLQKENDEIFNNIKGIILLSLVDLPDDIISESEPQYIEHANKMEQEGKLEELMPTDSFIHLISVKTFLRYVKYYNNIDFARYSANDDEFEVLNSINIPIFMRWGNVFEMIKKDAKDQVQFMNSKIKNHNKDIGYIEGADHSYTDKEDILANEISNFLEKIKV